MPFSQGTAASSRTSPASRQLDKRPGMSERKNRNRHHEPVSRRAEESARPQPGCHHRPRGRHPGRSALRALQPQTSRSQRWATSLRAWSATNQTRSRFWRRLAASHEPQPESSRVLVPGPPFRSAFGSSGRTVGARADSRRRLGFGPLQTAALPPIGDVVPDVYYPSLLQGRRVGRCLPRENDTRLRVISRNMQGLTQYRGPQRVQS